MEFASAIVSNLGALSATFPVPPPPPASPGAAPLIYFFPAAQTDGGSTILQPVLQYGNNDTFGGNGWQIASWYLDCNGQSFHSQPMNVNAGDTITASMISTCSGDLCTWTIAAAASNAETKATVQSVLELHNVRSTLMQSGTIIAAALETYGIDACSQYPGGGKTVFSAIDIEGVPLLTWKSVSIPQNRPCGENVVRNDDHTITLTY